MTHLKKILLLCLIFTLSACGETLHEKLVVGTKLNLNKENKLTNEMIKEINCPNADEHKINFVSYMADKFGDDAVRDVIKTDSARKLFEYHLSYYKLKNRIEELKSEINLKKYQNQNLLEEISTLHTTITNNEDFLQKNRINTTSKVNDVNFFNGELTGITNEKKGHFANFKFYRTGETKKVFIEGIVLNYDTSPITFFNAILATAPRDYSATISSYYFLPYAKIRQEHIQKQTYKLYAAYRSMDSNLPDSRTIFSSRHELIKQYNINLINQAKSNKLKRNKIIQDMPKLKHELTNLKSERLNLEKDLIEIANNIELTEVKFNDAIKHL